MNYCEILLFAFSAYGAWRIGKDCSHHNSCCSGGLTPHGEGRCNNREGERDPSYPCNNMPRYGEGHYDNRECEKRPYYPNNNMSGYGEGHYDNRECEKRPSCPCRYIPYSR